MCTTTKQLAGTILGLNYGSLMSIANDLADMVADESGRDEPKTAEEFASLLYDWADAQDFKVDDK